MRLGVCLNRPISLIWALMTMTVPAFQLRGNIKAIVKLRDRRILMVDRHIVDIGFALGEEEETNKSVVLKAKFEYKKKTLFGSKTIETDTELVLADDYVEFFRDVIGFDLSEYTTAERYAKNRDNLVIIDGITITETPKGDFFIPPFLVDKKVIQSDIDKIISDNTPDISEAGRPAIQALCLYRDVNHVMSNLENMSKLSSSGETLFDDIVPLLLPIWQGRFSSRRQEQDNIVDLLALFSNRRYRDHVTSRNYVKVAPYINADIVRDFMSAMNQAVTDQDVANELIDSLSENKVDSLRKENSWRIIGEPTSKLIASGEYTVADIIEPLDELDMLEDEERVDKHHEAVGHIVKVNEADRSSSKLL